MGQLWNNDALIFKGLSGSKALRKFITKHVEQWFSHAPLSYKVEFERQSGSNGIFCRATFQSSETDGEKTWVAAEWARTPEEAFQKCLLSFGRKGLTIDPNRITPEAVNVTQQITL